MRDSSENLDRTSTPSLAERVSEAPPWRDSVNGELRRIRVAAKTSTSGRVIYVAMLRRGHSDDASVVGCGNSRDSAVQNLTAALRATRRRALPPRTAERLVTAVHSAVREINATRVASKPRRHPAYTFLRLLQGSKGRR